MPDEQKWRDGFGMDYYLYGGRRSLIGKTVSENRTLSVLAAISGAGLELLFIPVFFLAGLPRVLLLGVAIIFHTGVLITMSISFMSWVVVDAVLMFREVLRLQEKRQNTRH